MTPTDLFDSRHYSEVRKPLLEASTLPPWCYTDPLFYQREIEAIFSKGWCFVGREDELPNAGDYLTYDGVPGPIIVIRTESGEIKAFFNSCRHRGTRLLSGKGSTRQIVCPYHSWVYSCDGELHRAPGMEDTLHFEKTTQHLLRVKLEQWAGFLFIRYTKTGPSLNNWLGNMPEFFAGHTPENLRCVRRKSFKVQCNWKFLIENALEAYHTGSVHRTTLGRQQSEPIPTDGEWSCLRVYVAGKKTISVLSDAQDSLPINADLSEEQSTSTFFTNIHPCTQFVFAPDSMWWLAVQPQGPTASRVEVGSCFSADSIAHSDFQQRVQAYFRRLDTATPEDNEICEAQQAGHTVENRPQGRFSSEEQLTHTLANWVLDRVL